MSTRVGGPLRRAGVVARWPLGMATATWRYVWRTTPLYREEDALPGASPRPALPAQLVDERVQTVHDGVGPYFHRRYSVEICSAKLDAEQLMARTARDPNWVAPIEVATFKKTRGRGDRLDLGDEYLIRMPGPWDGPVRVVDRTATSFRLATLAGHLEAGIIEFRSSDRGPHLAFEIESWARSGDAFSALLYDRWHLAKEMQTHMWTHVLERVARVSGGRMVGGISIRTERAEEVPDAP